MLNRRKIISTIFGMTTTPALRGAEGSAPREPKKYIMIVVDHSQVSFRQQKILSEILHRDGFHGPVISVMRASEPIRAIDLSNLPEADLAEVRRLCAEAK